MQTSTCFEIHVLDLRLVCLVVRKLHTWKFRQATHLSQLERITLYADSTVSITLGHDFKSHPT